MPRKFEETPAGSELRGESVLDISHEAIIRRWPRLRDWARLEAESARWYRDLARAAELFQGGEAEWLRNPNLRRLLQIKAREQWTPAWADQYAPGFKNATDFLDKSSRAQRRRLIVLIAVILLIAGTGLLVWKLEIETAVAKKAQLETEQKLKEITAELDQVKSEQKSLNRQLQTATDPHQRALLEQRLQESEKLITALKASADAARRAANSDKPGPQAASETLDLQQKLLKAEEDRDRLNKALQDERAKPKISGSDPQLASNYARLQNQYNNTIAENRTLQARINALQEASGVQLPVLSNQVDTVVLYPGRILRLSGYSPSIDLLLSDVPRTERGATGSPKLSVLVSGAQTSRILDLQSRGLLNTVQDGCPAHATNGKGANAFCSVISASSVTVSQVVGTFTAGESNYLLIRGHNYFRLGDSAVSIAVMKESGTGVH